MEPDELLTVIVRGFGSEMTHAATVPASALEPMSWPSPEYPFTGVRTPVVAVCERKPGSVQPALAVMKDNGREIRCRACRLLVKERGLTISYPQVHEETGR